MKKTLFLCTLLSALFLVGAEKEGRGALCLTFDDYAGANWLKADSLFKKYNAHVTFFIVGKITPDKIETMKKLQSAGHSIGLHSVHHRNAFPLPKNWDMKKYFESEVKPQLDVCRKNGIDVRGFAYPNNRRNEVTDQELFKHFDFLRAGLGKARKNIFYGAKDLKNKMLLGGGGIGRYYKSDVEALKALLKKAADTNTMIVFFSHNIYPKAKHVHMPTEMLEELLKYAAELKMRVIGINEIKTLLLR